jgi:radical SAM protein with 4Fe4S-binding SPASM domain
MQRFAPLLGRHLTIPGVNQWPRATHEVMNERTKGINRPQAKRSFLKRFIKESPVGHIGSKLYYTTLMRDSKFPPSINFELVHDGEIQGTSQTHAYMDVALFEGAFRELDAWGPSNIAFVGNCKEAEPFAHPMVKSILKVLKARKSPHRITWNTYRPSLKKRDVDLIIDAEIEKICFNINLSSLNNISEAIELLKKRKIEQDSILPGIEISLETIPVIPSNLEETVENLRLDGIDVTHGKPSESNPVERYPCANVFTDMAINYDGSVGLCRADRHNTFQIGNVRDKTIDEIWNSAKFRRVRQKHLKGTYDNISSCKDCAVWKDHPNIFFSWQYGKKKVEKVAGIFRI